MAEFLHVRISSRMFYFQWSRYMRCDGSPDPMNQLEINTYINLRLEDQSRDDAENVLEDSEMDLMVSFSR